MVNNVEADVVYKIKNKNVFILIEHQSSVDYKMSYRIMRYKYAIIESAIDKKRLKEKIWHMTETDMKKVDKSLLISISLA